MSEADTAESDDLPDAKDRERVGRLIVDADLSDEKKAKLASSLQRDTPFFAEQQTDMRIDVYERTDNDSDSGE